MPARPGRRDGGAPRSSPSCRSPRPVADPATRPGRGPRPPRGRARTPARRAGVRGHGGALPMARRHRAARGQLGGSRRASPSSPPSRGTGHLRRWRHPAGRGRSEVRGGGARPRSRTSGSTAHPGGRRAPPPNRGGAPGPAAPAQSAGTSTEARRIPPRRRSGYNERMARPVWTGSISFGLVNVPVKAYTAVRDHDVHFHQLEKGTGARIRNRKVSEKTGREVKSDKIEMGFEVRKGRYVTFDSDELSDLRPASTRAIEVTDFVALEDV